MKKMMIVALVMMSASAFANKPGAHVKVVSKTMDVVYFKVSCDMIGASIEILDANGAVIHTEQVTDKKVIVDFFDEPSGEYTIHVKKDGNDESIVYSKSSMSHAELYAKDHVTVTQM